MGLDLSAANKVLKEVYVPGVRKQFNTATVLLSHIERTAEYIQGDGLYAVIPLRLGNSEAIGARDEGELLPIAGNTRYNNIHVPIRANYGVIMATGHIIRACKTDSGAFIRAVDSEMVNMFEAFKKDINRQLFSDGTGIIATVGAAGATNGTNVTIPVSSTQYFRVGMSLSIYNGTTDKTPTNPATITAIDDTVGAGTITVGILDASVVSTDKIYRRGSYHATGKEITGLKAIVSATSTFLGLAPASVPEWKSGTVALPSPYVTNDILVALQSAYTKCEKMAEIPSFGITTFEIRDFYAQALTSMRRIVNTIDLKYGYKGLQFNDIAIVADDQAPVDTFYFINSKDLVISHIGEPDWADENGNILEKVAGYDQYTAFMVYTANMSCSRRNSHCAITGW